MSGSSADSAAPPMRQSIVDRWAEVCGNAQCRTAWLQLWRSRSAPKLEGAWGCSPGCMEAVAGLLVRRRVDDWNQGDASRELRMPLGLVLLSRGWVTRDELNASLDAQRRHSNGTIGEWLRRLCGITESAIAKGLAAQWNCTALVEAGGRLERAENVVPATLLQSYGLVLIRHLPSGRLYLAGQKKAEFAAAQALQHVLQVPVETAFLEDTAWLRHSRAPAAAVLPARELAEPHPQGPAVSISQALEHRRPQSASLVRIHDHLWLRMRGCRRMRSGRQLAEDLVIPLRAQAGTLRSS